jgi:glycolate oxidase FAD binding subunit
MGSDQTEMLQATVKQALAKKQTLHIVGCGSKSFLQSATADAELNLSGHTGVIAYEPSELYITARAGTHMTEIEALLAQHNQMLACEPPHFGEKVTLGGTVACGFSGSRRPFAGSVRDHILGVHIINGAGEILQFGGQVMKNVAGFDVSRLMVGARGTLGCLLELSIKVMPKPELEETLLFECPLADAPKRMSELTRRSMPISALALTAGHIFLRLEGTAAAIHAAHTQIGGETATGSAHFWETVREQTHAFFTRSQPLWRLSLPPATTLNMPENDVLIDWGGGLRWWHTDKPAAEIEALASEHGGYAYLFRGAVPVVGATPPASLLAIHQRLKKSFDPHGIFNPGLMGGGF